MTSFGSLWLTGLRTMNRNFSTYVSPEVTSLFSNGDPEVDLRPRGGGNTIHPSLTMPAATLDTHKKVKRINSWREVLWFRSLVGGGEGRGSGETTGLEQHKPVRELHHLTGYQHPATVGAQMQDQVQQELINVSK